MEHPRVRQAIPPAEVLALHRGVIGRFDLVALTEVRRDLSDLLRVMDLLPPYWDFVVSDYGSDRAANKERVAYVFDKRVVRFTGLAAEADPPRKRNEQGRYAPSFTWWRAPYIASFCSGNFDFVIVTVHLRWGSGAAERLVPLKARKRSRDECGFDRDLLVVGDMDMYGTGGMRRLYLRGRADVRKRLLVHACGFNLGVLMRSLTGVGTPRTLQGQGAQQAADLVFVGCLPLWDAWSGLLGTLRALLGLRPGASPELAKKLA